MNNLRFSIRRLLQQPTLAIVATLTLALAIGANTAVFSVIEAALLRELPFPESERLVILHERMYVVEDPGLFVIGTFVLRTRVAPEHVIGSVRQVLRELDSNLPVNDLMPLGQFAGRTIAHSGWRRR